MLTVSVFDGFIKAPASIFALGIILLVESQGTISREFHRFVLISGRAVLTNLHVLCNRKSDLCMKTKLTMFLELLPQHRKSHQM